MIVTCSLKHRFPLLSPLAVELKPVIIGYSQGGSIDCSIGTRLVREAEYTHDKLPSQFANTQGHVLLLVHTQFNYVSIEMQWILLSLLQ